MCLPAVTIASVAYSAVYEEGKGPQKHLSIGGSLGELGLGRDTASPSTRDTHCLGARVVGYITSIKFPRFCHELQR